ncbi:hypothetical protein [Azospirillum sp. B506]|uniref:hypothetical protein n=1 Tax=Azospirillum sp. B506 TaxID=137721 RepID=UPI00034DF971|nr:hypothetical protein [Azospirillum sp. B506]
MRVERLLTALFDAFVRGDELPDLILPASHTPILQRRRAAMIQSRVRMVALVFGILTPLWIAIDVTVFDWSLAVWLILLRLTASAAFLALAFDRRSCEDMACAWGRLAALLAVPTLFFAISHPLLYNRGSTTCASPSAPATAICPLGRWPESASFR